MDTSKVLVEKYVKEIFAIKKDKGIRAKLRAGLSSQREDAVLPYIEMAQCQWNILREDHRKIACLVAAYIAMENCEENGSVSFGTALARVYELRSVGNSDDNPGQMRLRRLLTCRNVLEVCEVLRPVLKLIQNKGTEPLDFVRLTRDLLIFESHPGDVKARWTQDFYKNQKRAEDKE